jgi:dihydrofolate reductase
MAAHLTVDLFVSMDGFAGSDGLPGYFGYFGPDLGAWIDAEGASEHTALMGRRSYELLASLPQEHRDDAWEQMARRDTVVFSRTLNTVEWPGARIYADDMVGEVRRLKESADAKPLRTIGSLSVARQLTAAGLVDLVRVMTFPLLAGPDGREPAFERYPSVDLQLIDTKLLDGRIHLTSYRPTGRDIPRGAEQREPNDQVA